MPDPLAFDENDAQNGWLNGDLSFARDGNYFVMFYADEEKSSVYGHQVILGKIKAPLSAVTSLPNGRITVRIELAE